MMRTCLLLAALASAAFAQFPGAAPFDPKTVVATIEGKDITLAEVRQMVDTDPRLMQFLQQDPQLALAQVFTFRHLAAEGEKLKLGEESPLKEQIETLRAGVIANALVNRERDTFPVSAADIDAYFERNRARYEQARIKAIYLAFRPTPAAPAAGTSAEALAEAARRAVEAANSTSGRTEPQAEALAAEIVKQLRGGADFTKLVEQYSDDATSKAAGGDFGIIKPDSSYPESVRKSVLGLKPGEVSDPVKSGNAIYIMRLEEKVMPPVADVRTEIIQSIRQDHLNDFMNQLNGRFKPTVKNTDFFARPGAVLGAMK
jgi:hypothetical protein